MVDTAASIVKLAIELSKIPETVKINRGQCQLLVDRIDALAAHLQRMQSEDMREQMEKTHEVGVPYMYFHFQFVQALFTSVVTAAKRSTSRPGALNNIRTPRGVEPRRLFVFSPHHTRVSKLNILQ